MRNFTACFPIIALVIAASSPAFAQGRHDEKPHGQKASAITTPQEKGAAVGGRHDERPHGPQKPAAKKTQAGTADTMNNQGDAGKGMK